MPSTEPVAGDDQRIAPLMRSYWAEMAHRYGDTDGETPLIPLHQDARWLLVQTDDGAVVGCGAVQPLAATVQDAPYDVGEVKRVYVLPEARGHGHSRLLMAHLVQVARSAGYSALWLDTGTPQHEAVALYERLGWRQIDRYGQFAHDERTLCYAFDL